MDKVNKTCAKDEERSIRVTRAKTRALRGIPPRSRPSSKNEQKNMPRANSKRAATSEDQTSVVVPALIQNKRRAVLTDVTNVCTKSLDKCPEASKFTVSMHHALTTHFVIKDRSKILNILQL